MRQTSQKGVRISEKLALDGFSFDLSDGKIEPGAKRLTWSVKLTVGPWSRVHIWERSGINLLCYIPFKSHGYLGTSLK